MQAAFQRIGFTANAAIQLDQGQGIDSLDELRELDDEEITSTCKAIRRPGVNMPNPAIAAEPDPAAAACVTPREVPAVGFGITPRAELNLKLAAFWCRYRQQTSRTTAPADLTLTTIRKVKPLREWMQTHKAPEAPENIISNKDWTKTLDTIVDHLRGHKGTTGIPLAYVVRPQLDPKDDPEDGWVSLQEELENRAPILAATQPATGIAYTDTFKQDNQEVWEIVSQMTVDTECWTYVKPARAKRDGRKAFMALYDHYLGPNNADHLAADAERKLANTAYYGEKKRWNFEKYVRTHVDQHTILEGLTQYGYAGIDARSKVRNLMDGIKTKELDTVKAHILSSTALRRDFNDAVTLYRDFLHQSKSAEPQQLNISQVSTNQASTTPTTSSGGDETPIEVHEVKDRYYNSEEYRRFTPDAKRRLNKLRADRGHQPNKKRKSNVSQVTTSNTQDEANAETVVTSNRTNPALTRQGKKG